MKKWVLALSLLCIMKQTSLNLLLITSLTNMHIEEVNMQQSLFYLQVYTQIN
jgi:hypothetical protein